MSTVFFTLTGVTAVIVSLLAAGATASYKLDTLPFRILQWGLLVETVFLFFLGCLAAVTVG